MRDALAEDGVEGTPDEILAKTFARLLLDSGALVGLAPVPSATTGTGVGTTWSRSRRRCVNKRRMGLWKSSAAQRMAWCNTTHSCLWTTKRDPTRS